MSLSKLGVSDNTISITFGKLSDEGFGDIHITKEQNDKIFKRIHSELKTKYKTIKCKTYNHRDLELCIIKLPTKQQMVSCVRVASVKSDRIDNMVVNEVSREDIDVEYFPVVAEYDKEVDCNVTEFSYDGIAVRFIDDGNGEDGKHRVMMLYKNKSKVNNSKASVIADIINKEFGKF